MDAFKLLSRSTKLKAPVRKKADYDIPSKGGKSNPQIYGIDSTLSNVKDTSSNEGKSRKRKRRQDSPNVSDSLQEVNYFGSGATREGLQLEDHRNAVKKEPEKHNEHIGTENSGKARPTTGSTSMPQDECRRILKLHKIKVVRLESANDYGSPDSTVKSKKNTSHKKGSGSAAHSSKTPVFPQPLMSFAEMETRFGVDRRLAANLAKQAYSTPTEVQLAGIPLLLPDRDDQNSESNGAAGVSSGRQNIDLLTVAPTGSGKTLAFLIPLIQSLLTKRQSSSSRQGLEAVILAPTKELASQIRNEAKKLTLRTGLRVALMRKGLGIANSDNTASQYSGNGAKNDTVEAEDDNRESSSYDEDNKAQIRTNSARTNILVATPMALLNAIRSPDKSSALPSVQYLVLDEADVLLDPLFREQTLSIWTACTNPALRVSLWSATMGSSIEELARSILIERRNSLSKSTGKAISQAPLLRLVIGLKDSAIPTISHKLVYAATEQGKLMALRQLMHPSAPAGDSAPALRPPFLVFTQSIPRAIALHSELLYDIPPEAGSSARIAVLHSDLSETARDRVMTRFRAGEIWVLITTDLLSRGVDFRGVNGVVNYDVPNSGAAYVHRAGRTGRAGREGGVAVTLYTKEDIPYVKNVANVIAASERLKEEKKKKKSNNNNNNHNNGDGDGKIFGDKYGNGTGGVSEWLLDALPTPTKREKKLLKRRGVEARRSATANMRISTKSGFERRLEHNKKGAALHRQRGLSLSANKQDST